MTPTRSPRKVVLAILFAALCVCLALVLRAEPSSSTATLEESVVVTTAPPRQPIPVTDSDNDGVPDWQDALQRTDPLIINDQTASYTPPDTLTGQFAESFFEQMVRSQANGGGVNPDTFIENNAEALFAQASDERVTRDEIIISNDNSPAALKAYGNRIAEILINYSDSTEGNEAEILLEALNTNNQELLKQLSPKIQAYRDYESYTLITPVPSSMVREHIALISMYRALANDITAMQTAFSDPALVLVRLEKYQDNAEALIRSIEQVYYPIAAAGVTYSPNDPASAIISIQP